MEFYSKSLKWKYRVIKNIHYKCSPRCDYPEYPKGLIYRGASTEYVDFDNCVLRKVIYPKELWNTFIDPNDLVESEIRYIRNEIYDWMFIQVIKNEIT